MKPLSKIEAAKIIGIEPRQLQNLADRGIVEAGGGGSRGADLEFGANAMFYGMTAGEMLKFKMSSSAIIESIAFLKKHAPKPSEIFKMRAAGAAMYITVKMDGNKQTTGWAESNPTTKVWHLMLRSLSVLVIDAGAIATKIMALP